MLPVLQPLPGEPPLPPFLPKQTEDLLYRENMEQVQEAKRQFEERLWQEQRGAIPPSEVVVHRHKHGQTALLTTVCWCVSPSHSGHCYIPWNIVVLTPSPPSVCHSHFPLGNVLQDVPELVSKIRSI